MLCGHFCVTTDRILGVDIGQSEAEINRRMEEADKCYYAGEFEKAVEILSNALLEYPNSYRLMTELAKALANVKGSEARVIALCQKILGECMDSELRAAATNLIVYAYRDCGDLENAVRYAHTMHHAWYSQEELLMDLLQGEEKRQQLCEYVKFCSNRIFMCLEELAKMEDAYTEGGRIKLLKQILSIAKAIYCDGDYNYAAQYAAIACYRLSEIYAEKGDKENTIVSLEKEADYRILFDTYDWEAENTSPGVCGYNDGGWIPEPEGSTAAQMLKRIKQSEHLAFIREEKEFKNIIAKLEEHNI